MKNLNIIHMDRNMKSARDATPQKDEMNMQILRVRAKISQMCAFAQKQISRFARNDNHVGSKILQRDNPLNLNFQPFGGGADLRIEVAGFLHNFVNAGVIMVGIVVVED